MPALTLRFDDEVHRKMKIIAATKGISLNSLVQNLFQREVDRWGGVIINLWLTN